MSLFFQSFKKQTNKNHLFFNLLNFEQKICFPMSGTRLGVVGSACGEGDVRPSLSLSASGGPKTETHGRHRTGEKQRPDVHSGAAHQGGRRPDGRSLRGQPGHSQGQETQHTPDQCALAGPRGTVGHRGASDGLGRVLPRLPYLLHVMPRWQLPSGIFLPEFV